VSDPRPEAIRRLAAAGVDSPRLDARLLWDHAQHNSGAFACYVRRRIAREPVAYITGHKEFWSLDFEVGPGVLIPRPETETIVEQVLTYFPGSAAPLKVLDLGTGSGCLLVALLKEFRSARGLGIDSSEVARAIATRNIARHGLADRAEIAAGNWMESLAGDWDVVVSNPPYIATADIAGLAPEVSFEPFVALDGGEDGLDAVRALAAGFRRLLKGTAFVEIGAAQAESVQALMASEGLFVVNIAPDLAGIPRILVTRPSAPGAKKELE
jgi:release factor glutamine methyltransferase